jgi:hypothetical protein
MINDLYCLDMILLYLLLIFKEKKKGRDKENINIGVW